MRVRVAFLVVTVLLVSSGCCLRLPPIPAWQVEPAPGGGWIAFESGRDGNPEIYKMRANGGEVTRLTDNPAWDRSPSWSPDGTRIAFSTDRDEPQPDDCHLCNWEIYIMNADGSGVTRLTNHSANDSQPSWSPDGTRVAFSSDRDGYSEIYIMNADGTEVTRLTDNRVRDQLPSWSPDGEWIAFESDPGGNWDIYRMSADGSQLTRLTSSPDADRAPFWSPDGTRIAFSSDRDGGFDPFEIYIMDADGGGQTNLTNTPGDDAYSSWSPDGTQITFMSTRDGSYNWEIYRMRADGSGVTRLTQNAPSLLEAFSASEYLGPRNYLRGWDMRPSWGHGS